MAKKLREAVTNDFLAKATTPKEKKKASNVSVKNIVDVWKANNTNEKRAVRSLEGIYTALHNCEEPAVFEKLRDINSRGAKESSAVTLSLLQHAVGDLYRKFLMSLTTSFRPFVLAMLKGS